MLEALLIAKPGHANTGVGRYVRMLEAGLRREGVDTLRISPTVPRLPRPLSPVLNRLGLDAQAFFTNYPVWARYSPADIVHLTSQNLASMLVFRRPRSRLIVTVHDIIPYLLRDDPQLSVYRTQADRLFDRLAMRGLRRADRLIADSHYTKQTLVEHLGIPAQLIDVVYLGIDHQRFRPRPTPELIRERYGLPHGRRYLIYTGSDDPRKNLPTLLRAVAMLRTERPDVELIKVGRPHFMQERQRLVELAERLGIAGQVHFLDEVPEADLPLLYSLADVAVLPSLYEGFGFPVLEAMACGTPVVCSRAASLPELVDDAALTFAPGPGSFEALASAIRRLLDDPDLHRQMRSASVARARTFQWSTCARQVLEIYRGEPARYESSVMAGGAR